MDSPISPTHTRIRNHLTYMRDRYRRTMRADPNRGPLDFDGARRRSEARRGVVRALIRADDAGALRPGEFDQVFESLWRSAP